MGKNKLTADEFVKTLEQPKYRAVAEEIQTAIVDHVVAFGILFDDKSRDSVAKYILKFENITELTENEINQVCISAGRAITNPVSDTINDIVDSVMLNKRLNPTVKGAYDATIDKNCGMSKNVSYRAIAWLITRTALNIAINHVDNPLSHGANAVTGEHMQWAYYLGVPIAMDGSINIDDYTGNIDDNVIALIEDVEKYKTLSREDYAKWKQSKLTSKKPKAVASESIGKKKVKKPTVVAQPPVRKVPVVVPEQTSQQDTPPTYPISNVTPKANPEITRVDVIKAINLFFDSILDNRIDVVNATVDNLITSLKLRTVMNQDMSSSKIWEDIEYSFPGIENIGKIANSACAIGYYLANYLFQDKINDFNALLVYMFGTTKNIGKNRTYMAKEIGNIVNAATHDLFIYAVILLSRDIELMRNCVELFEIDDVGLFVDKLTKKVGIHMPFSMDQVVDDWMREQ